MNLARLQGRSTPAPGPSPPGICLQSCLGSGPSGHVYRARDGLRGRDVAVKLLDPRRCTPGGLVRLAASAARVSTAANAPRDALYEVVPDPSRPFVITELQPGESLQRMLLRAGPMTWERARAAAHAIALALEAAHAVGVVHGAVKPTNVFLLGSSVRLTDFGIRTLADPFDADALLASAEYLAPEQLRGEPADERSDLYNLGLLMFELVTGRLPFFGLPREVFKRQLRRQPPAPTSIVPSLPPEADRLILHLLEKDPKRRPSSVSRLRALLSLPEPPPSARARTRGSARSVGVNPGADVDLSAPTDPPGSFEPDRPVLNPACPLAAAALATALAGSLAMTCL